MRVNTISIPVTTNPVSQLVALVVEPALNQGTAPVLLFLHGKVKRVHHLEPSRWCVFMKRLRSRPSLIAFPEL